MTDREKLWQDFSALPTDAQQQVADLITFLRSYLNTASVERRQGDVRQEAFFGIWQGREDLNDSSAWVRDLRQREWSGHR